MNTADYCAEGRELYAEYMALKNLRESIWLSATLIRTQLAEMDAYRRFKEHVDKCDQCKKGGE